MSHPSFPGARRASVIKILLILAACGVVALIVCGGLGWWGVKKGLGVAGDMIAEQVRDHSVILEHIGDIQSAEIDLGATASLNRPNAFVIILTGSKGDGRLTADTQQQGDGSMKVTAAALRLPDGGSIDLDLEEE